MMTRIVILCLVAAAITRAEDVWVIGNIAPPPAMQRVVDDSTSKAVLIQEQMIGRVPVVFESQAKHLKVREDARPHFNRTSTDVPIPAPLSSLSQTNLMIAKGRWTSEQLPTDTYSGVKQYAGVTNLEYTYFLAQDVFVTGMPIRASASTNSVSVTVDGTFLPVPSIPVFLEVVDDIAGKELGWTTGVIRRATSITLSVPLRNMLPNTTGPVVSVHLTNFRGVSLLSGGSYLDGYFGWTGGVSRLHGVLSADRPQTLFSVHLRLNLEDGTIWN